MDEILKDLKIFDIDPYKLRSKDFFETFVLNERERFWDVRKKLNKSFEDNVCIVCSNQKDNELYLEYNEYTLVKCSHCDAIFANIEVNDNYIEIIYNNNHYEEITKVEILDTYEYRKNKFGKERFEYIMEKCKIDLEHDYLLDFGCGAGYFLKYLQEQGFKSRGLEVTDYLVDLCKQQQLDVDNGNLIDEENNKYKVITMFDVLEHLLTPIDFFHLLNTKLSKGGYILAYTPNIQSFAFKFQGGKQNLLAPYEHVCFYTLESLNYLASQTGFEIVNIDFYGLDMIDYFSMKEYEDKIPYNKNLAQIIPTLQAILDKNKVSNHMRVLFKKK